MQAFDNQLTEKEIAAVVTYQRNAWGNDTGDVVQASEVNAYKAKQEGGSDNEQSETNSEQGSTDGTQGLMDEAQNDAKEQL